MALNLSGLFRTNVSDTKTATPYPEIRGDGGGRRQTEGQVRNLEPGQTLRGEIVGRSGDDIQIRIAKDIILNARMEQELRAAIGENVTFEVRSNSSGLLSLRPLFQNMAQESTVSQALSEAGVEVNGKSMQMVSAMMEEGMPVDRESVQDMYRQVVSWPKADISALVQLNRLQIPVTAENLQQFTAYQNYEHQLVSAFSQAADEISQTVLELFSERGPKEGMALIDNLLTIFAGEGTKAQEEAGIAVRVVSEESLLQEGKEAAGADAPKVGAGTVTADTVPDGRAAISGAGADILLEDLELPKEGARPEDMAVAGKEQTAESGGKESVIEGSGRLFSPQEDTIPQEARARLAFLLQNAGGSPETAQRLLQGDIGKEALYRMVQEMSRDTQGSMQRQEAVRDLFVSKEFQNILKERIGNQWTLTTPESVEKESVSRLYERLNEQTRQLTQALSEAVKEDSPLFKSVQNIRENVDFMNQLNQMYTYVQLPLKFRGENAHGDLYVYTNKRNLAKKDGNVSAFLHLEMQHLGTVDVYVAMEQGRISTNFTLADEESLRLLEENIHILTKRLTDKGYRADAKLTLKEEPGNVMQEILETDKNACVISEQSFDVRA